jgi:hypothetical protein
MFEQHAISLKQLAIGKTYKGVKIYDVNVEETGTTDLYLINGRTVSFAHPDKAACWILAESFSAPPGASYPAERF